MDSTGKLEMLRSIGADHVIDYTQQDFTKSGQTYDVIFDGIGRASYAGCMKSLNKEGIYLLGNPSVSKMIRGLWAKMTSSKKVIGGNASYKTEDLIYLKELIEAGKIRTVIDKSYPLEQTADAHTYVETGQKVGNVAITINQDNK